VAKYPEKWMFAQNLDAAVTLKILRRDEFEMKDYTNNGMLYHQRRILDDGQLLFFVNSNTSKNAIAEITLAGKYVSKLDLISGKIYNYLAKAEKGKVTFRVELDPVGSALFAVTNKKSDEPVFTPVSGTEMLVDYSGKTEVKRESDNIMMVNYLDIKTAKSDKKDVYFMDALIGLFNENGVEMGNPWQHKIQYKKTWLELDSLFKNDSWFEVNYHFNINEDLDVTRMKSIRAVVERTDLWKVFINGNAISKTEGSFWIDKEFPQFAVGGFLKPGKNTITLKAPRMHILAEVMPIYLLGDFLVQPAKQGFEITGSDMETLGSWSKAGLPFYSQKVVYSQKFNISKTNTTSFKVKLNNWNGSIAEIFVNNQSAGVIAWQPNELDVTSILNEGENEISVKVIGSLKNTFGFFYQKNDNWIFSPHLWNYAPKKIPNASEYFLLDYGLMEPFDLVAVFPKSSVN
jgi:hypothetical protein